MKNLLIMLKRILYGILIAVFTIGVSTIITLKFKFIYSYSIDKYNLVEVGKISKEMLIKDFNTLINYLQNPFIKKLQFINFPMSLNGEFHFYEVKKIFLYIYAITIIITLFFLTVFLYNKISGKSGTIYKVLNYGANSLICIIVGIVGIISINFSKAFIIFHKIFFNNDYWIFDERTDPIINVLPEDVFKLYALAIITLISLFIIGYKIYFYKKSFKKVKDYNKNLKL